eukprot:1161620-Pelagomonas_calceolata.AAC.1
MVRIGKGCTAVAAWLVGKVCCMEPPPYLCEAYEESQGMSDAKPREGTLRQTLAVCKAESALPALLAVRPHYFFEMSSVWKRG